MGIILLLAMHLSLYSQSHIIDLSSNKCESFD